MTTDDKRNGDRSNDLSNERSNDRSGDPLAGATAFALAQIDRNLPIFAAERFPAAAGRGLIYPATANVDWTTSFWTGLLWLAFELTGEARYREAAQRQLPSFAGRLRERIETDTHDLGFLYSLSAVAEYRLTGNPEAKALGLEAAALLASRYHERAGIIQAWGDPTDPEQCGRMIIDCLMNLPLLYWASAETGDETFARLARSHARQSAAYLVRPDGTSFHTYYMDVETGSPLYGNTHQGYADDSCWARGQAWGIYGFALSGRYTGENGLIDTAKRLADYMLERLPADGVVYWDLVFTAGEDQERDSSAAAIAACGLLELAGQLAEDDPDRRRYADAARRLLTALDERYTTRSVPESNGILRHAVYNKPRGWGIDECVIWGDYFFVEALLRSRTDWQPYW